MLRSFEYRNGFRNKILELFPKDKEVWIFHPKTETIVISNCGKVKNLATGKILSFTTNRQGYQMTNIVFNDDRKRRCYMVQRLVVEAFYNYLGNFEQYYEANHINGNKKDNSIYNLEWLTRQENLQHARDTKLFKRNTAALGYYKYSDLDIDTMKNLYNNGISMRNIAKQFNGCRNYISGLIRNKTRRQKCQD